LRQKAQKAGHEVGGLAAAPSAANSSASTNS